MKITSEDDILEEETRKQIITEIEAGENQRRKSIAYKRREIWKDRTKDFVRELLILHLDSDTVAEMEYAMSNISIVRKIIDKLAKVYANGVQRAFDSDDVTQSLNRLERKLKATLQMKTVNKLLKLHRNALLYIKPVQFIDKNGETKFRPSWVPMSPYLYDVVEGTHDRTEAMVYILSNFERKSLSFDHQRVPELAASHKIQRTAFAGNGVDEKIADVKEDEDEGKPKKQYIWWTDKWHFTTLGSEIVNPETNQPFATESEMKEAIINPIEEKPFVDFHIDQEGHYWAEGGEDLIDGGLLINSLLSNAHHIGITQGYGQLVVSGVDQATFKTGPNKVIVLPEPEEGKVAATAAFITASPPLTALAQQVEMYLALLLTTNNLSTTGVAASLKGGIMAPSGIALAIDKAESLEDVKDQREIFLDGEEPAWRKTAKWIQHFSEDNELDPKFEECKIPEDEAPTVVFGDPKIIMSETENLTNIEKRQALALNTQIELIMKDRDITKEEASKILLEITKEKIEKMNSVLGKAEQAEDDKDGNRDNEDES